MPDALLDRFSFWQNPDDSLSGYPLLGVQETATIPFVLRVHLIRDPVICSSARIVRAALKGDLDVSPKSASSYDQRVWTAERSAGEGTIKTVSPSSSPPPPPPPPSPSPFFDNFKCLVGTWMCHCFLPPRFPLFSLTFVVGEYTLLNLLYAAEGSFLAQLRDYLSRVEDMAHVLVWTKGDGKGNALSVDLIELPRLGISFARRVDSSGASKLYSSLHVGMYLSLKWSATADKLFAPFPHGLVLENIDGEMALMVPATLPQRVKIVTGGARLVFCHTPPTNDAGVVGVVAHYYYPTHLSNMFLFTTTLESALYLILMRAVHYLYSDALQLADACITDSVTPEAAAIWDCMQTILTSDPGEDLLGHHSFPDANAFRLRMNMVSLLAMHVDYTCKWSLQSQLAAYVTKLGSISATCRLEPNQEVLLLQSLPLESRKDSIMNKVLETFSLRQKQERDLTLPMRQMYLATVLAGRTTMNVLYPERAALAGQYDTTVDKSCLLPHDESFLSKFTRTSYKRPIDTTGAPAVGQIQRWLGNGLRLGGGKDDLGFMFLYELMTGSLQFTAVSGDNPYYLGCVLVRLLAPKDYTETSLTMSMLRVLARNPTLAADPSIPKVFPPPLANQQTY